MKPATRLFILIFALVVSSTVVFAQTGGVGGPDPADPSTTPLQWYTSVGGVGLATIFLVGLTKRYFGTVDTINKVPTWCFGAVYAFVLTVLCVKVFGTLPGPLWQMVWQAVYNAAIATGIYEGYTKSNRTLKMSATKAKVAAARPVAAPRRRTRTKAKTSPNRRILT